LKIDSLVVWELIALYLVYKILIITRKSNSRILKMNEINQINNEPVKKSRILLVDDEPGLRTAVKTFLEDEGFEIFIAVDGDDGWEKAQTIFPDLIISDVMMPRTNGYDLLKKIREDEKLGGTPVIFLTAKGMTLDRTEGYLAGVDDYISKPFDPDELAARVKNVINRQERLLKEAARFADIDVSKSYSLLFSWRPTAACYTSNIFFTFKN